MPRFDAVTGISTGALIAPFALIGSEAALETVADLYRNPADIMPGPDPLALIRPTGGIVSRARMERTIARVLNESFAQQLRPAFAESRQIFVGTTNLDRGTGAIWSIGDELSARSLARVHQIMIATSAIPGVFAPVELDGETHIDGGVTASLLLGLDLPDFEALAAKLRQAGVRGQVRLRVFAIVNFWVHPPSYDVEGRNVRAVRDRADRLMFSHAQQFTITRFWDLARAVTAGVPGLTMELRYTAIPRAFSSAPGADRLFDQAFMQRLQEAGFARAQGASPWDELPLNPYRG